MADIEGLVALDIGTVLSDTVVIPEVLLNRLVENVSNSI